MILSKRGLELNIEILVYVDTPFFPIFKKKIKLLEELSNNCIIYVRGKHDDSEEMLCKTQQQKFKQKIKIIF